MNSNKLPEPLKKQITHIIIINVIQFIGMLSLFEIYGMKQLIFIPWTIMFLLSTYTRILVLKNRKKGDVKNNEKQSR
ncbi:hypothetical protein IR152_12435 [Clostridioides sp. ES-S-0108-01]|uniref:hypothetical protein n=1 Tax=unclassified Clostridioides TaxID=2635829 RepID=UPI001D0C28EE|nr:hypothetical protein [Clostridioides sp. ES-S-0171-01]MCC0688176.1 hypothetical protein [Clostridioides sp. ES-S-0056-01]MCC0783875.1 hypothetical protein [Clostridioides sp. ES-S-0108-01]UDN51001.1 hypothetical protein JJC16_17030 [Clostridioides sp. ES-S-0107-01]UDN54494.1 hypothetical protein JJC02_16785 [Clostridioides sp. ES-S-0054-01]